MQKVLTAKTKNYKSLTKPDKIFLGNPNRFLY